MKGGYLHNQAIADELVTTLEQLGARVQTEYPVRPGSRSPAVDIYAELAGLRIACEIELSPRRVRNDIAKGEALGVDLVLIVTATASQAAAIKRRLGDTQQSQMQVRVMPLGAASRYLSELSPVLPLSNEGTNTRTPVMDRANPDLKIHPRVCHSLPSERGSERADSGTTRSDNKKFGLEESPRRIFEPKAYRVSHVAELLSLPRSTVYDLTRTGVLRSIRTGTNGRIVLVPAEAVAELLEKTGRR